MSHSNSHPAMHEAGGAHAGQTWQETGSRHFVPIGWEDTDRGLCPCGEAVRWDPSLERWVADRSLVVLVLTEAEYHHLRDDALYVADLEPELDLQFALNRWPDDAVPEPAADQVYPPSAPDDTPLDAQGRTPAEAAGLL